MSALRSLICALLLTVAVCSAHFGSFYEDESPHVYCGRSLSVAISALCDREGYYVKRSGAGTMYNVKQLPYYKEQGTQVGWPWLPPQKARGLVAPSRGKNFAVNECCEKACNLSELLSYC